MPDTEATEADVLEQEREPAGAGAQVGPEVDEADAVEQALPVRGAAAVPQPRIRDDVPEADALEQSRDVDLDDDDYR